MASAAPINSLPYTARVGTNQTNLYFYTSTTVTQDSQGKVNGGVTTLNYSPTPGNYVPAAKTPDGGKTWEYLKDKDGNYVLGVDARKSLQEGVLKTNTNTFIKDSAQKAGIPEQQAKTLQLNQNTASSNASTETGDQQAPYNEENRNAGAESLNNISIGNREGTRGINEYPDNSLLRYPITMDPKQDCIKFTMLKYVPKKLTVSSSTLDIQENRSISDTRRGSTVVLPIQPSISDSNNVKWGSADMSTLQGMAASVAMKAITDTNNFAETTSELASIASGISAGNQSIKSGLAALVAGRAAGVKGLLTRVTGAIENPNMELLFDGPDLRTFSFSFSLSAREPEEAKTIRNIIRFFKQGMSVKRADTGLFLQSPNTFEIKYMFGGTDEHPWINKIKECALTSCTVNYTPAGNYATYEDGSMTQYDLTLSFSELEPIYDDDYKDNGGTKNEASIGY
jgi:hypothetical protein